MEKWLNKVILEGNSVILEPLSESHEKGLAAAVSDGNLWELWFTSAPKPENVSAYIQKALQEYENDISLPFLVKNKNTLQIIGTTRYTNATPAHKRLEIGYTWYAKSFQRTGVNTECKYLLLQYAFEHLHCIAVEFRTHFHNFDSRAAIARLGAKQDGILRNHSIDSTGCLRDTVVFSIINNEWQTVKKSLEYRMRKSYYT
ncbi:MAG: GNAT family N-acetyltransferase [Chitinophagales bacterium]|nr:GNAT family N-acetyltransferase [Bacteroidota bacterium]MCB9042193.1 GNAT family N-acetyltransferase [Chitinophagales bacterium]